MKIFFIPLFCLLFFTTLLRASGPDATDEVQVQGHYFGKNIIIVNPLKNNEFSVKSVFVNGNQAKDEINSSAFELDLSRFGLQEGDPVIIKINYTSSIGKPEIYNPSALLPSNTFRFVSAECDKKNLFIHFTVEGHSITESFEVEHYRWDKWMTVKLVNPNETKTFPSFSVPFSPHSGRNLFRVRYIDTEGNIHYSSDIKYTSKVKEVILVSDKVKDVIELSDETMFQLYDENGALLLDGIGSRIEIAEFAKGKYFLNFDNKTVVITKR
jgi:hypothetical protein